MPASVRATLVEWFEKEIALVEEGLRVDLGHWRR
jgi:hypothetical protein